LPTPLGLSDIAVLGSRRDPQFAVAEADDVRQKLEEDGRQLLLSVISRPRASTLPEKVKLVREAPQTCLVITESFIKEATCCDGSSATQSESTDAWPVAVPFTADLDDVDLFPALHDSLKNTSPTVTPSPSEEEADLINSEEQEEWVIVSSETTQRSIKGAQTLSASSLCRPTRRASRKRRTNKVLQADEAQGADIEMDWSLAGIPREMNRRLINGNTNAAHLSMYAKKELSTQVPRSVLRSQSRGDKSTSRNALGRSRSASRTRSIHQPTRRR